MIFVVSFLKIFCVSFYALPIFKKIFFYCLISNLKEAILKQKGDSFSKIIFLKIYKKCIKFLENQDKIIGI